MAGNNVPETTYFRVEWADLSSIELTVAYHWTSDAGPPTSSPGLSGDAKSAAPCESTAWVVRSSGTGRASDDDENFIDFRLLPASASFICDALVVGAAARRPTGVVSSAIYSRNRNESRFLPTGHCLQLRGQLIWLNPLQDACGGLLRFVACMKTGVQHGCHFGQPCSRAVFTGAGSHYPCSRPVDTAREHS